MASAFSYGKSANLGPTLGKVKQTLVAFGHGNPAVGFPLVQPTSGIWRAFDRQIAAKECGQLASADFALPLGLNL